MAVRDFGSSGDRIQLDVGTLDGAQSGAHSFFAIVKNETDASFSPFMSLNAVSTVRRAWWYAGFNELQFESSGFATVTFTEPVVEDVWLIVGITKAAGIATPRAHVYNFSTDTWVHADFDDQFGDDGTTVVGAHIGFHDSSSSNFFGRMALVGLWKSVIGNDAAVEAAGLEDDLNAWVDLNPDGLWPLNQTSITIAVEDITGNGADQTSRTGTTVVNGDDPPGFTFSTVVTGTAAAGLGFAGTATGEVTHYGVAAAGLGFTGTATGSRTVAGVVDANLGFTGTAQAATLILGEAQAGLGFSAVVDGTVRVHGTAAADFGFEATARSGITVTGVAVANLGGLTAVAVGQRQVDVPRFFLVGPTYQENLWTGDRFFVRYSLTRGTTLAIDGDTVDELTYPYQEDLEAYDFVYRGGHEHKITAHEANILIAAGYGEFITPL